MYGCFLDTSKALDHDDHSLLFKKLIQRNLLPAVVRTLLSWYSDQCVIVSWDNTISTDHSMVVLYGKLPLSNLGLWKPPLVTYSGMSGCFDPRRCHTSLLHLVSGLQSFSNVVIECSHIQTLSRVTGFKVFFIVMR